MKIVKFAHKQICFGLLAVVVSALAVGCTGKDASAPGAGVVTLAITTTPPNVLCLRATVAGSTTAIRLVDTTPGQPLSAVLTGLPTGAVTLVLDAYPVACASLEASTDATWASDPLMLTLVPGVPLNVAVTMHHTGRINLNVSFDDGTDAGTVVGNADGSTTALDASVTADASRVDVALPPAPTCVDMIKNGSETDVDCGGPGCAPCTIGKVCGASSDCASHVCLNGVCAAAKPNGSACSAPSDCLSNFCVSGVCCNTSCQATCFTCAAPAALGTCSPMPAGVAEPLGRCPASGVCGNTGACDGAGACQKQPVSTVCAVPACAGSTLHPAALCDGHGTCNASAVLSCAPYVCSGVACVSVCSSDSMCVSSAFCNSGACTNKLATGALCSANSQCVSGACTNAHCL